MYSMQHITYHAPVVLACVLLFLPVTSTLTLTKRDLPKGDISSHIPLIATRLTLDGFYKESISEFSSDATTEWQGLTSVNVNSAKMRPAVYSGETLHKKTDANTPYVHSISSPPSRRPFVIDNISLPVGHHKSTVVEPSNSCVHGVKRRENLETIVFTCTFDTTKDEFERTDKSIYTLLIQKIFDLSKCSVFAEMDTSLFSGHDILTRIFVESKDVPSVMKTLERGKLDVGVAGEPVYLHVSNPAVTTDSEVVREDAGEMINWGVFTFI